MGLSKRQRTLLRRLHESIAGFGNQLDYTATSWGKMVDRQQAHRHVSQVLFTVLCDSPENDQLEYDLEEAEDALKHLEGLKGKEYRDKSGN